MANYIVGDIQGCFDELYTLLQRVNFNDERDRLWIVGDLVARGPKSLETLRYVYQHRHAIQIVLGNHDLHLLAVSEGLYEPNPEDRIQTILDAPDRQELLAWLRQQPLLAEHGEFVICHAGISPQWTLNEARIHAREVEAQLQQHHWIDLLGLFYGNRPTRWDNSLQGVPRYRYIVNAFTRMRFCNTLGFLELKAKHNPNQEDELHHNIIPWFEVANRFPIEKTIIFGHWAALDGYQAADIIGLDTGCVWGRELTLYHWEEQRFIRQKAFHHLLTESR